MSASYFADWAWLPEGCRANVRISVIDGRFSAVQTGAQAQPDDQRLPGVVLPGIANTHSHAFHRALRGRTHAEGGTFWTWRNAMYAVAARLDPANYYRLARAVFAEMALSGVSCVGEFHYVHHQPDGTPYADPNAMGHAVIAAAESVGIRITLLDTCYLSGGLGPAGHLPLSPEQLRFGDGSAAGWAQRWRELTDQPGVLVGAAIHSVRAVPANELATVVATAAGRPLHVHLSEQPAENEQCLAVYGLTPTALLAQAGALAGTSTVVHATHLTGDDIALLGAAGAAISFCPTTERDLADGIGPARELAAAGCPLTLGSDQNAVIDLLEEARALEMDERLASHERGRLRPDELIQALTSAGHAALGWPDAGRIEVGRRADLVAVRTDSVRTTGARPDQVVLSASAVDVNTVIVDGRIIVQGGRHLDIDVAAELGAAVAALWE
jgi:formiminoglutamate deiminase